MEQSLDEMFTLGIELRNEGNYKGALKAFFKILKNFPNDPNLAGVYIVVGGIYRDLEDPANSMVYFHKATLLRPKSELASLGLHLAYVELDESAMAIKELKRYLDRYSADMYKVTLLELLGDLDNGYATNFEGVIRALAKRHDVKLNDG